MVDMILKQLPKIAAEVAAPLQNVGKITLVAGPNGKIVRLVLCLYFTFKQMSPGV